MRNAWARAPLGVFMQHDPYNSECSRFVHLVGAVGGDSSDVVHQALRAHLPFVPWSTPLAVEVPGPDGTREVRLHIGQVPYSVTAGNIALMCAQLGAPVYSVEAAPLKPNGERTGGFFVQLSAARAAVLFHTLHHRVLIEHTGFWLTTSPLQVMVLDRYEAHLKQHGHPAKLPYRRVSVELSKPMRAGAMARASLEAAEASMRAIEDCVVAAFS
jgi:hypothetical protein